MMDLKRSRALGDAQYKEHFPEFEYKDDEMISYRSPITYNVSMPTQDSKEEPKEPVKEEPVKEEPVRPVRPEPMKEEPKEEKGIIRKVAPFVLAGLLGAGVATMIPMAIGSMREDPEPKEEPLKEQPKTEDDGSDFSRRYNLGGDFERIEDGDG